MKISKPHEIWLIVGSQHLYGADTLKLVTANAEKIAATLNAHAEIPLNLIFSKLVTTSDEIYQVCNQANSSKSCIGVITWMHTFSPAKMWIRGLQVLAKPLLHLHTQFNREIPWDSIDMDFMNLNQSAHGDREFGHLLSRLQINHKILAGHWQSPHIIKGLACWMRAALGWHTLQNMKVARIGDNMREVAVTEGDKLEAQAKLGFSVNGFGVGDLVAFIEKVSDNQIEDLLAQYKELYTLDKKTLTSTSLREAARIECGLRIFLESGEFDAFTNTLKT